MCPQLTRREFLKVWGVSLGSLVPVGIHNWLPLDEDLRLVGLGRVTIHAIGLYQEPSFASQRLKWLSRDKLVNIITEVDSPEGPPGNPRWYQLYGGYAHSAYIQRVEHAYLHQSAPVFPGDGRLAEVTVPFTQAVAPSSSGKHTCISVPSARVSQQQIPMPPRLTSNICAGLVRSSDNTESEE